MKLECRKEEIGKAVSYAEKIASKNNNTPILKCLYLEAKKGALVIRATNLDVGIEISIVAKVEKEGVLAVPASFLNGFISNMKGDGNITLQEVSGNINVSTKSHSTLIKCLPHQDFPLIPKTDSPTPITLPATDLASGFKSVWYSASISSLKPELSSIYVYSAENNLVFVATDAFRLAEKKVKTKESLDFQPILIPSKNAVEIVRVIEGAIGDEVNVLIDKNQIAFAFKNTYITSRVIDGVFPDYKPLIPKGAETEAIILKQDFIDTLKIANVFADKFNKITIQVHPKEKSFEIKTKNADVGESSNLVPGSLTGEDVDINFNYKNIADVFQSINSDSLSLSFNGLNKPLLIRGVSDNTFSYIVMPMNK